MEKIKEKYGSIIRNDIDAEIIEKLEAGKEPKQIKEELKKKHGETYHSKVYRTRNKYSRFKKVNGHGGTNLGGDMEVKFTSKPDVLPEIADTKHKKQKKVENQEITFKISHVDVRNMLNNINEALLGGEHKFGWSKEDIEQSSVVYGRALAKADSEKVSKGFFVFQMIFTTAVLVVKPLTKLIQLKNLQAEINIKSEILEGIKSGKIDPRTLTDQEKAIIGYTKPTETY